MFAQDVNKDLGENSGPRKWQGFLALKLKSSHRFGQSYRRIKSPRSLLFSSVPRLNHDLVLWWNKKTKRLGRPYICLAQERWKQASSIKEQYLLYNLLKRDPIHYSIDVILDKLQSFIPISVIPPPCLKPNESSPFLRTPFSPQPSSLRQHQNTGLDIANPIDNRTCFFNHGHQARFVMLTDVKQQICTVKALWWEMKNGIEAGLKVLLPAESVPKLAVLLRNKANSGILRMQRGVERIKMP